jgi:hypothetical protein
MKRYQVRRIGSGEDVRVQVEAPNREAAIEQAEREHHLPWKVTKVTARPVRPGDRNDQIELKLVYREE